MAARLKNVPHRCLTEGWTFHLQVPRCGIGTVHLMTFVQRHKVMRLCAHAAGHVWSRRSDIATAVRSGQTVETVDGVEEKGEL